MKNINILWLYPKELSIYGDRGNMQTICFRAQKYGYAPKIYNLGLGDKLSAEILDKIDIIFAGGGSDASQKHISKHLSAFKTYFFNKLETDAPFLLICGAYQLFCNYYKPLKGEEILGIGLIDGFTLQKPKRFVGNIALKSPEFGYIYGFENHSGYSYLNKDIAPFGEVLKGGGNSGEGFEGARIKNLIASYLHGPLLPKNPKVADYLINKAVQNKYHENINIDLLKSFDEEFLPFARLQAKDNIIK